MYLKPFFDKFLSISQLKTFVLCSTITLQHTLTEVNLSKMLTLIVLTDLQCPKPLTLIVLMFLKGVLPLTLIALTEVGVLTALML